MAAQRVSLKQLAINKDNTTILIVIGLASFLTVFSLVASKSLLSQSSYQAGVISKKKATLKQVKKNATEAEKLRNSYQAFAEQKTNILGGAADGTGDLDGENPRIVLDALPSKYDFPGLTTSLTKMFKDYKVSGLTGSDDELTQSAAEPSSSPTVVEIPFSVTLDASAQSSKDALKLFERSIRPIQVNKLTLTSNAQGVKLNVNAKTYFQPPKKFDITSERAK